MPENEWAVTAGDEIVSDSRCFICGLANVGGLQVRFFRKGTDAAVATCDPAATFMGYEGLLHGGIAAALLDEIMIKAVLAAGQVVVTGRLGIQYHKPISLGDTLQLERRIVSKRGRIIQTEGRLYTPASEPLVSA